MKLWKSRMHTNTHIDALHSSKIHSPFSSGSHTLCGQGLGIIMKLGVVSLLEAGGCVPSATCRISAVMADSHLARQDTAGTASVKAFVLCFYFIHFFFFFLLRPFFLSTHQPSCWLRKGPFFCLIMKFSFYIPNLLHLFLPLSYRKSVEWEIFSKSSISHRIFALLCIKSPCCAPLLHCMLVH